MYLHTRPGHSSGDLCLCVWIWSFHCSASAWCLDLERFILMFRLLFADLCCQSQIFNIFRNYLSSGKILAVVLTVATTVWAYPRRWPGRSTTQCSSEYILWAAPCRCPRRRSVHQEPESLWTCPDDCWEAHIALHLRDRGEEYEVNRITPHTYILHRIYCIPLFSFFSFTCKTG